MGYTLKITKCAAEERRSSSGPIVTKVTKYYTESKGNGASYIQKKGTAKFIGHISRRNSLLKCVTEGKIERTGRRGRKRKQLFHDPTEKSRDTGN